MIAHIQGLRAVAVFFVVVYHFFPEALPGGFTGVDVFFVLSGFLMAKLLFRDFQTTKAISVTGFLARRFVRLIPAALFVITVIAITSAFLPITRIDSLAEEIVASSLFYQNWLLAARSVDYLAMEVRPSVLQHYWSLAVEMQFYMLFPVCVAAATFALKRPLKGASMGALATSLAVLVALFAYSSISSFASPARAYFATDTRLWQFALGSCLVLLPWLPKVKPASGSVLASTGVLLLLAAAFLIDESVVYPGVAALVPAVGAFLVIALGSNGVVGHVLASRPFTFFGDISYSLYLWHWPLLVLGEVFLVENFGTIPRFLVIGVSVLLALFTKVMVEDPFRMHWGQRPLRQSALALSVIICIGAVTSTIPGHRFNMAIAAVPFDLGNANHPGAAVLVSGARVPDDAPSYLPSPAEAKRSYPIANYDKCQVYQEETDPIACRYGTTGGAIKIALIGDSHAAQLSNAFKLIAERNAWEYLHLSKAQCPISDALVKNGNDGTDYDNCLVWLRNVEAFLMQERPAYVFAISTWRYAVPGETLSGSFDEIAHGAAGYLSRLRDAGLRPIVIRDTPFMGFVPADCVAEGGVQCGRARAEAVPQEQPKVEAARRLGLPVVDLTDAICAVDMCAPIVGNVFAWRDSNHLTAPYVETMAGYIDAQIKQAMREAAN